MSRQALRITEEVTPGTRVGSPGAGTVTLLRIVGDNDFPDRPEPNIYYVRDAAGSNRKVQAGKSTVKCSGRFNTLDYFSQNKILMPWMFNLVTDGVGGLKPAFTVTIDHLYSLEDGATVVVEGYLGCYAGDATVKASNTGDGVKTMISSTFLYMGVDGGGSFTDPAMTAYPSDLPAIFQQTVGGWTLNSVVRTSYKDFEIRSMNILDQIYDESIYPQAIKWCGRDVSFKATSRLKSLTDRTAFNTVAEQQNSLAITDGTTTTTFDFKGLNVWSSLADQTPLPRAFYQAGELMALVTPATTDLAVTTTP